jgi:ribulose-phosphate 3-epimerase
MTKVAPSLLAADFTRLKEELDLVARAGCELLHLDVMDGHFVPNLSFGPFIIEQINRLTEIPLDVHLMISNPGDYLSRYLAAGADYLTVHGEVIGDNPELLQEIRGQGAKAGLSLNPDADIDDYRRLFEHLDLFLVMSVYAGFGGQEFMPETLDKVRRAVAWREQGGLDFEIAIDGGINEHTAALARDAGVDILVAGTAFFKSSDPVAFASKLRAAGDDGR